MSLSETCYGKQFEVTYQRQFCALGSCTTWANNPLQQSMVLCYACGKPGAADDTAADGSSFIHASGDGTLYVRLDDRAIPVTHQAYLNVFTEAIFTRILRLPTSEFEQALQQGGGPGDVLSNGAFLMLCGDQPAVFLVDHGVKRHVLSPETMVKFSFDWANIRRLNSDTVECGVQEGPPIA